jgi:hypothetical protein
VGPRRRGQGRRAGEEERARAGGEEEGEGEREEKGWELTSGSNSGDHRLQNLGHHGEREVEEGEGGSCAGNPNERGRGGGGPGGGGQGRQGRAGRATSRIETHDTHDPQKGSNRESKSETKRDEHATSNKEMRFGMMQHP